MKIKIEKMGINGEGIGYYNRVPVFVEGAIEGEIADVQIDESYKTYKKGHALKIFKTSNDRVKVACPHYEKCGACQIMHMKYEKQLKFKRELIVEAIAKYADLDENLVARTIANPNQFNYRNSLKLPVAMRNGKLVSGLYEKNTNHFLMIDKCMIHEEGIERIKKNVLNVLNKYGYQAFDNKTRKGIKSIFVRGLKDKYQLCIVTGNDKLDTQCISDLSKIEGLVSIDQSIHTTKSHEFFGQQIIHLYGKRHLGFNFNGLDLKLSTRAFFQLNTRQAANMYNLVKDLVPSYQDFIFEAYSGIGAISMMLHDRAKKIVGVESIIDAVNNANHNAKNNGIENVSFVCDDAALALMRYSKKTKIDTLIVDPPRTGLDDAMIDCILRSKIDRIIYVSCNPATLAKNLYLLKNRYVVKQITPLDMFSQSAHVESITLLERKTKNN